MNILKIISKHPSTNDEEIVQYDIDGERTIGAWEEAYAIEYHSDANELVEVRLSIDGTDIITGKPATLDTSGQRWVVRPHATLKLEAWPEGPRGGGRFLFTSGDKTVAAHTHNVTSDVGYIAAAVFVESYEPPAYYGGGFLGGAERSGGRTIKYRCMAGDSDGSLESKVGTGVGEYVEQHIGTASGLRKPRLKEVLHVRVVWSDELQAKLKAASISSQPSHVPGFPGGFIGIDVGNTPRQCSGRKTTFEHMYKRTERTR